MIINEHAMD